MHNQLPKLFHFIVQLAAPYHNLGVLHIFIDFHPDLHFFLTPFTDLITLIFR